MTESSCCAVSQFTVACWRTIENSSVESARPSKTRQRIASAIGSNASARPSCVFAAIVGASAGASTPSTGAVPEMRALKRAMPKRRIQSFASRWGARSASSASAYCRKSKSPVTAASMASTSRTIPSGTQPKLSRSAMCLPHGTDGLEHRRGRHPSPTTMSGRTMPFGPKVCERKTRQYRNAALDLLTPTAALHDVIHRGLADVALPRYLCLRGSAHLQGGLYLSWVHDLPQCRRRGVGVGPRLLRFEVEVENSGWIVGHKCHMSQEVWRGCP